MKVKQFFQWLTSYAVSLELEKHPRIDRANLLLRMANMLYSCLNVSEQEIASRYLDSIKEIVDAISTTDEKFDIVEAVKMVRQLL